LLRRGRSYLCQPNLETPVQQRIETLFIACLFLHQRTRGHDLRTWSTPSVTGWKYLSKHGISTALYNNGRLPLSRMSDLRSTVQEHISCMVGWTTGTQDSRRTAQHVYSYRLEYCYSYEQHTNAPSDKTLTQIPVTFQEQNLWTEQVLIRGQNRVVTPPPGQSCMYLNGIEVCCGQPEFSTIELSIDGLLEYQEQRQRATGEQKEPSTPAQRRRKAQNRTAYVSQSPTLPNDFRVDTSRCL
jgi:hypothetical protein